MNQQSQFVRSIAMDLVLTLVTCGIWNIYVQHQQIIAVNDMLKEQKYNFAHWLILTFITCGLYHIYHEWRMMTDIAKVMNSTNELDPIICIVLTAFGLSPVCDAIQQARINQFYGNNAL